MAKKKETEILKNEKKTTIAKYPKMLERKYVRELARTVKEIEKIVMADLVSELKRILNVSKNEDPRFDSAVDDLSQVIADVKVKIQNRYPPELLESLAERRGLEVSEASLKTLNSQVKQVQGIDLFISEQGVKTKVAQFVKQNVNLIETVHQSYFKDVQTIVYQGVGKGESVKSMTQKIRKRTGVSQNRAKLIARDQTQKLNSNLNATRHSELGIKKFVWTTAKDERVRDSHADLDGRVFTYRNGADVDGESGVLPGEPINCRCIAIPVFEK